MDTSHLTAAIRAAHRAGATLKAFYGRLDRVERKDASFREVVSEVDGIAERTIVETLREAFPASTVSSEECGLLGDADSAVVWVVDPIDGTVNYVNGNPTCGVSVACLLEGRLHAGVVHNPFTREFYYAQRDGGVWLNEVRIGVSRAAALGEALLACAFSSRTTPGREHEYAAFGALNDASRGCLRSGSAAMNLAWVACGKLSGTWGRNLKLWDVAAGLLLVHEAGGRVTLDAPLDARLRAGQTPGVTCVASNGTVHEALLDGLAPLLGAEHASHL
jgi:myo-inositol-1(or 4)-monophosphatase